MHLRQAPKTFNILLLESTKNGMITAIAMLLKQQHAENSRNNTADRSTAALESYATAPLESYAGLLTIWLITPS